MPVPLGLPAMTNNQPAPLLRPVTAPQRPDGSSQVRTTVGISSQSVLYTHYYSNSHCAAIFPLERQHARNASQPFAGTRREAGWCRVPREFRKHGETRIRAPIFVPEGTLRKNSHRRSVSPPAPKKYAPPAFRYIPRPTSRRETRCQNSTKPWPLTMYPRSRRTMFAGSFNDRSIPGLGRLQNRDDPLGARSSRPTPA